MGLLSGIGDIAKKGLSAVGSVVGGAVGGPAGAAVGSQAGRLLGGGSDKAPRSQQPQQTPGITGRQASPNVNLPMGPVGGPPGVGAITSMLPSPQQPQQQNGGGPMAQQFQQGLMMQMLQDSVRSKDGKSILEAMLHGSLQGGMIQQPVAVDTPRGTRHYSQPGFRTVDVGGQKVSVFKPLARALRLLPKKSRAKLTNADFKTIRKADRLTKKVKKLAKKTNRLKVTNK